MNGLRDYLLCLTSAAILCAVVKSVLPGKGPSSRLITLICGAVLTVTALKPIVSVDLKDIDEIWSRYVVPDSYYTDIGENMSAEAMADIIKEKCEAYIQDKATSLGLDITVSVDLNEDDIPAPAYVRISGQASPYGRSMLQQIIASELGVGKEGQEWISEP